MMESDPLAGTAGPGHRQGPRWLPLVAAIMLSGCAAPPRTATIRYRTVPPVPVPALYVYPAAGQSAAQLDRDRYGCHLWAVQQSGFDPALPDRSPRQASARVEPPSGASTAAGAATGALLGAVVARSGHAGQGAVIGAVAGGLVGAAADSARQQSADRFNQAEEQRQWRWRATQERSANGYRRAITACLVGRGYTVR